MKKRIIYLLVLFAVIALPGPAWSAKGAQALSFSIIIEKQEYNKDESITFDLKIENKGALPVWINKRMLINSQSAPVDAREVTLSVTSPSGVKLPCRITSDPGLPKSDYFVSLRSGESATLDYKRNLGAYFDLKDPGVYTIKAVYENRLGREIGVDAYKDKIEAAPITISIKK